MKRLIPLLAVLLLGFISNIFAQQPLMNTPKNTQTAYVIPIQGEIDPSLSAYLKRALREIKKNTSEEIKPLIVLEIDTFGGRVDSALAMVDTIVSEKDHTTIAYVKTKAISAGALIALSCNTLYMRANTTIGDCAPIIYSKEGPKELGEKFQSPLRAQFRALAKKNGYSEALTESMVSIEMAVYEVIIDGEKRYLEEHEIKEMSEDEQKKITSKKLIVGKNELLTMDDSEAIELGFSRKSVSGIEEVLEDQIQTPFEIIRIEESWSETLVGFIGKIAPILMLIGLGSLYTELKVPGFGIAGFIGIACLLLVFFNQYLVGLANYTEFLLLLGGILLLGFEIFVLPGFGIAGISGILFIALGMVLSFQDFVIPDPSFPWQMEILRNNLLIVLGTIISGFILSLLMLRFVLVHVSKVIKGPYLEATLKDAGEDPKTELTINVGDIGEALTFLRPAGKMILNEEIFDVITRGEFIEKKTPLKVEEISQNRIIVTRKG